ncbi:hypothetical protein EIP91_009512, partial [Steccherinum ochraceum]
DVCTNRGAQTWLLQVTAHAHLTKMAGNESCKPSFEGLIPFKYQGETFETYTRVYGELKDSNHTPVVALHGGPGLSHDYLRPLSDLSTNYGFPVIMYDQIGNAKSTHLKDKPETFWTIDLFIDELENILKHFGVSDDFHLLGHSWGGILGLEFEVRRKPKGLKKFVSASSLASTALWMRSTMELAQTLPQEVGEGLAVGMKDPKKYWEALQQFHAHYGCDVLSNRSLNNTWIPSFGCSENTVVAGNAHPWCLSWQNPQRLVYHRSYRLHLVRIPVFMINGRKDIAQDYVVRPLFDGITKVKWVTFENSSHMPLMEERERFMKLVSEFLL